MEKTEFQLYTHHAVETTEVGWSRLAFLSTYHPVSMSRDTGAIQNHCWTGAACVFQQLALDGNTHTRTDEHIRTSRDMLHVYRYLSGGSDGISGSVPFSLRPGSVFIHDYTRPFEALQMTSVLHSLHIPHDLVGFDKETMPAHILHDLASHHGAALNTAFDDLMAHLFQDPNCLETHRLQAFSDVIRAALPAPGAEPSLKGKIQLFIEDRLHDHRLSQADIQEEFQLSRGQLYGLLDEFGGVEAYVTLRRAFRAFMELRQSSEPAAQLKKVAEDWGFASSLDLKSAIAAHYPIDLDKAF